MALHKDLTGSDLHEPKGITAASSGQVYQANGSGSGTWSDLNIPAGFSNVSTSVITANGTWTKPADCFMIKVTCVGGGGTSSAAGGTSSFGSYVSATGGDSTSGSGGTGSLGDINLTGQSAAVAAIQTLPGLPLGLYGLGKAGTGSAVGGSGGGVAIKYILNPTNTVAVTVGSAGAAGATAGVVIVESYISG